jgi:hypothetical protein
MERNTNPNPGVKCGVDSCEYHDDQDQCLRQHIQVNPQPDGMNGTAADESMCSSYHNKKGRKA